MHSEASILEIMTYFSDSSKLVLQSYRYSKNQLKDIKYTPYRDEDLDYLNKKYKVTVRY